MTSEPTIVFEENIQWTEGFHRPEKEQFGIWQPKAKTTAAAAYYLIDWDQKLQLGPFSRRNIFRAYVRANAWMMQGDAQGPWNFGFYVVFKQRQPVSHAFEKFQRIDPLAVSPALALYTWNDSGQTNPPVDFGQAVKPVLSPDELAELIRLYELPWTVDSVSMGSLQEARNFHKKGASVLTRFQRAGEIYAILDGIENYPEFGD